MVGGRTGPFHETCRTLSLIFLTKKNRAPFSWFSARYDDIRVQNTTNQQQATWFTDGRGGSPTAAMLEASLFLLSRAWIQDPYRRAYQQVICTAYLYCIAISLQSGTIALPNAELSIRTRADPAQRLQMLAGFSGTDAIDPKQEESLLYVVPIDVSVGLRDVYEARSGGVPCDELTGRAAKMTTERPSPPTATFNFLTHSK